MDRQTYTVGWVCAVQTEYVAACELLDDERPPLPSFRGVTAIPGDGSEGHALLVRIDPHRTSSGKRRESAKPEERHPTERRGGRMSGGEKRRRPPVPFGKAVQGEEFEITGSLNSSPTVPLRVLN